MFMKIKKSFPHLDIMGLSRIIRPDRAKNSISNPKGIDGEK
jgi:hypothetical protein